MGVTMRTLLVAVALAGAGWGSAATAAAQDKSADRTYTATVKIDDV